MAVAREIVGGQEDDTSLLAAMGIPQEMWDRMRGDAACEVWPENWDATKVFLAMQTQWRIGMNGVTGLDYTPLQRVMQWCGIRKRKQTDVFDAIRIMEAEGISVLRRDRQQ